MGQFWVMRQTKLKETQRPESSKKKQWRWDMKALGLWLFLMSHTHMHTYTHMQAHVCTCMHTHTHPLPWWWPQIAEMWEYPNDSSQCLFSWLLWNTPQLAVSQMLVLLISISLGHFSPQSSIYSFFLSLSSPVDHSIMTVMAHDEDFQFRA